MDNTPSSSSVTKASRGLVANGSAGGWGVEVDETLAGTQKWFLQLDGPAVYLYFQIDGPDVVDRLLKFVETNLTESDSTQHGEVRIGHFGQTPVVFLWDPEGAGRGVVLVSGRGDSKLRVEMLRDDVECIAKALRQVRADLCAEGLCNAVVAS